MNSFLPVIISLVFAFIVWPLTSHGALQVTNFFTFNCLNGSTPAVIFPFNGGFFGSTQAGGMDTNGNCLFNGGTIYTLDLSGQLHTRATFVHPDAWSPNALLPREPDGTIWGTTFNGGTGSRGTVFKLTTNDQLIVVADFGATPGYSPADGLTLGADGNFYGATYLGGGGPHSGSGTIFKVVSNSTIVTLHQFQLMDGYGPAITATDRVGNIFGVTEGGGLTNENFQLGLGTIFRINTNGVFTSLFQFNGTNGYFPFVGLTVDESGQVFGSTMLGGDEFIGESGGKGTIFSISTNGVFMTLHDFSGGVDGELPYSIMTIGRDGKLYGSTIGGGAFGFGTLFSISKQGELTTLYSFGQARSTISLSFGSDGCLYAVQQSGQGYIMRFSVPMSPTIRSITKTGNQIELSWDSVAGQVYQVQRTYTSNSTNWIDMGSPTIATNSVTTASDNIQLLGNAFYRVALLP